MNQTLSSSTPPTLYADDVAANRRYLRAMLEKLGLPTQLAENGREALELWRQGRQPLVLLDLNMPEMDGSEVAQHIRAEQREDEQVVILGITADMDDNLLDSLKSAGMDDCISKPTSADALSEALAPWIQSGSNSRQQAEDQHMSLLGDPELLQQLMTELPQDADALQNAFTENNRQTAREVAHRISGVAAMYRMPALAQAIEQLQEQITAGAALDMALLEPVTTALAEDLVELQSQL